MKAIVLTCDKYRKLTEHMIFKYEQLWPEHPFKFIVPYQDQADNISNDKIEYIKTPNSIKSTVSELLKDLDDEEYIYWCMDDKYPVEMDIQKVSEIYNWINNNQSLTDGVLFCRCRSMWNRNYLSGRPSEVMKGIAFIARNSYKQIWLHQFLKVKVLRHLFNAFPDEMPSAKIMDDLKDRLPKPDSHRIFVTRKNYAVFGESTSRGILTLNCHNSLIENDLDKPVWATTNTGKNSLFGMANDNFRRRFRYLFKTYDKLSKV